MARAPIRTKTVAEQVTVGGSKLHTRLKDIPPPNFERVVSTGSALLDLTISGGRIEGGGVPYGMLMEIFGPSGAGKTSILAEICGSAAVRGGTYDIKDPEARLDEEYSRIYGISINKDNYTRPDTVTAVFDEIWSAVGDPSKNYHVSGIDSLAALSTNLELEKGDKMGMRRAKEFSEALRKTCRMIANNKWLVCCTNQIRQGDGGETTPGGNAFPFYASLRLRIGPSKKGWQVEKGTKLYNKDHKKIIGIRSTVYVRKSSVDEPYRSCDVFIIFGYGVHDVMTNLQFVKDITGDTKYPAVVKSFQAMDHAVAYIEENGLEQRLREEVEKYWNELEDKFKTKRKPKVRF